MLKKNNTISEIKDIIGLTSETKKSMVINYSGDNMAVT